MYLPDGTKVYGARGGWFEGVESCKIMLLWGGHFLFICSDTVLSAVGCII